MGVGRSRNVNFISILILFMSVINFSSGSLCSCTPSISHIIHILICLILHPLNNVYIGKKNWCFSQLVRRIRKEKITYSIEQN